MTTTTIRPKLTERQQEILDFVREHQQKMQRPPTIRAICERFGFRSPNGALNHVTCLVKKGYLTRESYTANGLRLVDTPDHGEEVRLAVETERERCIAIVQQYRLSAPFESLIVDAIKKG